MAKQESHTQLMVFQHLRNEHGITLTDEQLDTIDEVYLMDRKNAVFTVGIYRFINTVVSLLFIFIYLILGGTKHDNIVFILSMVCFLIYNAIHCWNNIFDYKLTRSYKLKTPFQCKKT